VRADSDKAREPWTVTVERASFSSSSSSSFPERGCASERSKSDSEDEVSDDVF
jgi:hypothetical protein